MANQNFVIRAVEPDTDDVLSPSDTDNMRLPFDEGWDHWSIFQGPVLIFESTDFDLVERTCRALNSLVVMELAA